MVAQSVTAAVCPDKVRGFDPSVAEKIRQDRSEEVERMTCDEGTWPGK